MKSKWRCCTSRTFMCVLRTRTHASTPLSHRSVFFFFSFSFPDRGQGEVARAICCLVQSGCIRFDLDGNFVEEWDKNDKRNRNKMKEQSEDRHNRKLDDANHDSADISNSISLSLHAEMISSRHFNLGARTKWQAQATPSHPCPSGEPVVPPWRDKSLWRITTTQTVEGLLSEKPSESTKIMEKFC